MQSDRAPILSAVREFFAKAHGPKEFIAGQTYIPVTTKVMDADDLEILVDASLDLWLTAGRFAREF